MKDKKIVFEVNGKEYTLIFNLNVMQEIQNEYETVDNWGNLTDGKTNGKETDIKALIFGIKAMLNEAIDIENEKLEQKKSFLTDKQVGRLITDMGLSTATEKMQETVISGTSSDNPKNE